MWNDIWPVLLTSTLSVAVLFLLTKLLGNKQISQLSMFDYIIGISIGSIAAELATELESPVQPLAAMVVYALIAFAISILTQKSVAFRRIATGRALVLMDGGVILRENLKKARFDLSDFLTLCRISGYFDLSEIHTAILEENGTVSFLPKEVARPAQPSDFQLFPEQTEVMANVVMDGRLIPENLKRLGREERWLAEALKSRGYSAYKDVFLAACDRDGKLFVSPMQQRRARWDPFT